MWIAKPEHGLPVDAADSLMSSYERPEWLGPTVDNEPGRYVIYVAALAWGVHRMLRDLFADSAEVDAADATARALLRR